VTPKALEPFDPVDQTLVTVSRDVTTVPGQALFLLNSRFVQHASQAFTRRLAVVPAADSQTRIELAYQLALGRPPEDHEVTRVIEFLNQYTQAYPSELLADSPTTPAPADTEVASTSVEVNPDEVDPVGLAVRETNVVPASVDEAAWMAFTQALLASAEFRYIR